MAVAPAESPVVEPEESSETDREAPHPWDPEQIRILTKTFALGQILEMLECEELELAPEFQRDYVWKVRQQSRLIESVLLGIPLPMFYFNQDPNLKMQVVDGLQRLTTIQRFSQDQFPLEDLEYLTQFNDLTYSKLNSVQKRRFRNTQIQCHVIDPQTPFEVKLDIFRRINTGGSPLNAQEIRHCLSSNKVREFLNRAATLPSFTKTTNNSLSRARRMEDKEIVLRFFAFLLHAHDYPAWAGLDSFLGKAMETLDSTDSRQLQLLLDRFEQSMKNNYAVFQTEAFRKPAHDRLQPINRALFDCWSVALADIQPAQLEGRTAILKEKADALTEETYFSQSISSGTDSARKVQHRFSRVQEIVMEVCGSK